MASMLVCFGSQRNTFRCFELHGDTHAYPPLCTYTHTHTCTHTRVCVIPGLDKLANEVNLSHGVRPVLSIQHTPPSVSPHQSFFLLVFFWCSLSDHHLPSPTFTFPLPPKMEGKKKQKTQQQLFTSNNLYAFFSVTTRNNLFHVWSPVCTMLELFGEFESGWCLFLV